MKEFFLALGVFGIILAVFIAPCLTAVAPFVIVWYNKLDAWHTFLFFGGIALVVLAIIVVFRR